MRLTKVDKKRLLVFFLFMIQCGITFASSSSTIDNTMPISGVVDKLTNFINGTFAYGVVIIGGITSLILKVMSKNVWQ